MPITSRTSRRSTPPGPCAGPRAHATSTAGCVECSAAPDARYESVSAVSFPRGIATFVHVAVCPVDHGFEGLVLAQLGEADTDRSARDRLGEDLGDVAEAARRERETRVDQRAHELVTAVAREHVVRTEALAQ